MKKFLQYTLYESDRITINVFGILSFIVIIVFAMLLVLLLRNLFKRLVDKGKLEKGSSNSIFQITKYFLWTIAIIISLQALGINISIFLAGAAALLVGIGLGLQQLFNDIASGVIILLEQNLKLADVIEFEDGSIGKVIDIGLRTSKVRTRDNIITIVPNSRFVNHRIINWSHFDEKSRFHVKVGVAYGTDVDLVVSALVKSVDEIDEIIKFPKPHVRFADFGDSSLDFMIFFWCIDPFRSEMVKSDVRFNIHKNFKDVNIQIPFPQRDIHIKSDFRKENETS